MDSNQEGEFQHDLDVWSGNWPECKFEQRHRSAFWVALLFFDLATIRAAFKSTADEHAKEMPGAQLVRQRCVEIEKSKKEDVDSRAAELSERQALVEQANRPGRAPTKFENLARDFRDESNRLGLRDDNTPKNVGLDRVKQIQAALEEQGE